MSPRIVELDEDAYARLRQWKRAGESFSDVVKRLTRSKRSVLEFAGAWSDMTPQERTEMAPIYREMGEADRRRAERIGQMWE